MAAVSVETARPGDIDRAIIIHQLTALEQIPDDGLQTLGELRQARALGSLPVRISISGDLFELQNWWFFHRAFGTDIWAKSEFARAAQPA